MKNVKVVHNYLSDPQKIVELACKDLSAFRSYPTNEMLVPVWDRPFDLERDSEYEESDRYHILYPEAMSVELQKEILLQLCGTVEIEQNFYCQINRYDKGDYVLPHRDSTQQGLYLLTNSESDGIYVQSSDNDILYVRDQAGSQIVHDPAAWHWVNPVVKAGRFTLVTIPPLPSIKGQ